MWETPSKGKGIGEGYSRRRRARRSLLTRLGIFSPVVPVLLSLFSGNVAAQHKGRGGSKPSIESTVKADMDQVFQKITILSQGNGIQFITLITKELSLAKYWGNESLRAQLLLKILESKFSKDQYVSSYLFEELGKFRSLGRSFYLVFNKILETADIDDVLVKIRIENILRYIYLDKKINDPTGTRRSKGSEEIYELDSTLEVLKKNPRMSFSKMVALFLGGVITGPQVDGKRIYPFGGMLESGLSPDLIGRFTTIQEAIESRRFSSGLPITLEHLAKVLHKLYPEEIESKIKILNKQWPSLDALLVSPEYLSLSDDNSERLLYLFAYLYLWESRLQSFKFVESNGIDVRSLFLMSLSHAFNFDHTDAPSIEKIFLRWFMLRHESYRMLLSLQQRFSPGFYLFLKNNPQWLKARHVVPDDILLKLYARYRTSGNPLEREAAEFFKSQTSAYVGLVLRSPLYADRNNIGFATEFSDGIRSDRALKHLVLVFETLQGLPETNQLNERERVDLAGRVTRNLYFKGLEPNLENIKRIMLDTHLERVRYSPQEVYGGTSVLVVNNEKLRSGLNRFGPVALQQSITRVSKRFKLISADQSFDVEHVPSVLRSEIVGTEGKITLHFDGHGNAKREKDSVGKYQLKSVFEYTTISNTQETKVISMRDLANMFVERYRHSPHRINALKSQQNDVVILSNCHGETMREFAVEYLRQMKALKFRDHEIPTIIGLTETEYGQLGYSDYSTPHHSLFPEKVMGLSPNSQDSHKPTIGDFLQNDHGYDLSNPTLYLVGPKTIQLSDFNLGTSVG